MVQGKSAPVGLNPACTTRPQVRVSCLLNRAACCLKTGAHEGAIHDCTEVLSGDFDNVKALFRRGQAHAELKVLNPMLLRISSSDF